MSSNVNPLHNGSQPEPAVPVEQQALLQQLQMTESDLESWMFGDRDLESILAEPGKEFPYTYTLGPESTLGDCQLWPLHEQYYSQMGVSAWDSIVPCFITSSAFIAEAYAEMLLAFLDDHLPHLDLSEPIYIVEMATGVGRFSHLLLLEIEKKLACFERFSTVQIRYLMTDFTENNINFWRTHEKFQHFIEKGMLDFAVFRPEDDCSLNLMISGKTLNAGQLRNPLVAIANYFFDTIRQDAFRINNHQLEVGLVTMERTVQSEAELAECPQFDQITLNYRYEPVSSENYYPEAEFNRILADYEREIENGSVIMPIGALRTLQNLRALSEDNLVLLSSDKAYSEMNHMLLYRQHNFAVHGSFSYMVNYDAIGRLFKHNNGWYFHHNQWSSSLATVCCVGTRTVQQKLERLQYYITQHLNVTNRITTTMNANKEESNGMEYLLATVRLSLGDPRTMSMAAPLIIEGLPTATIEQKHDLLVLMDMAWQKFFFYRGERNLAYWFAELYYHLNLQHKALECLDEALKGYSEYDWEYFFMQGRSYEGMNQWEKALECHRKCLALRPDFEKAHEAVQHIETMMSAPISQGQMTA